MYRFVPALCGLSALAFAALAQPIAAQQGAADRPMPDPNNIPALIDWAFDVNGCTVTESQLFDLIESHHGLWTANITIVNFTESPDFAREFEATRDAEGAVIFTRTSGGACGGPTPAPTGTADLSAAARWLIDEAVAYECQGNPGRMDPQSVFRPDIDGDGREDLVLDHQGITCNGALPLSCGAQVCETRFYLRRGQLLQEALVLQASVNEVSGATTPTITMRRHGGGTERIRWSGNGFSSQ